jgi:hypothetical protein
MESKIGRHRPKEGYSVSLPEFLAIVKGSSICRRAGYNGAIPRKMSILRDFQLE